MFMLKRTYVLDVRTYRDMVFAAGQNKGAGVAVQAKGKHFDKEEASNMIAKRKKVNPPEKGKDFPKKKVRDNVFC